MARIASLIVLSLIVAADFPAGQASASAALAGTVVSAEGSTRPIRRAVVTLTGGGLATNVSAVTDDAGRFAFASIPAGRYTITASKPGFLTSAYGANRPGRPGTPISIAAGQHVTDLQLPLARGAVIGGTVRDALGDPAPGILVTVVRADLLAGMSGYLSPGDSLSTDDRGQFRAYGLAPGEYVVAATPRVTGMGDITQPGPSEVEKTIAALRQRRGISGAAPRSTTAATPATPASPPPIVSPPVTYAPIFHPGTAVAADAGRVRVNAGDVRDGVDLTLALVPASTIEGTVVSPETMSSIQLSLTPFGPPLPIFRSVGGSRPGADGTFKLTGVTPGRYTLLARGTPGPLPAPTAGAGRGGTVTSGPLAAQYWAMADLHVTGSPIAGLTLTLRPPMEMSGRVAFESASAQAPADLTRIRIGLTRPDVPGANLGVTMMNGMPMGNVSPPPTASVTADGTFTLRGILPAVYKLTATMPGGAASEWWLKSALVGDRDVLDSGVAFDVDGRHVTGAVLTFSDRRSELSGALQSASGQPASDYYVVVFSANREHWRPGSRRVASTRPSSDGGWMIRDLPAGEYLIAALTDVEPGEWQKPEFLAELVQAGVKVRLGDGARVRQDLRIAK